MLVFKCSQNCHCNVAASYMHRRKIILLLNNCGIQKPNMSEQTVPGTAVLTSITVSLGQVKSGNASEFPAAFMSDSVLTLINFSVHKSCQGASILQPEFPGRMPLYVECDPQLQYKCCCGNRLRYPSKLWFFDCEQTVVCTSGNHINRNCAS